MSKKANRRWPAGPWATEPDRKEWADPATGLRCLIVRHPSSGHLCGYVAVPTSHPWHGKDYGQSLCSHPGCYDHRPESLTEVHGGLTYTDKNSSNVGIEGEDALWWFGFDCAHSGDGTPLDTTYGTYRDMAYVEAQCANLARQLHDQEPQP